MTPSVPPPGVLDEIHIEHLLVRGILGINPDERIKRQDYLIHLVLWADLSLASASDEIQDTVDYKKIKTAVLALAEASSFGLVERLAQAVADTVLEEPRVRRVQVRIEKPGALRFARSVAFQITRERAPSAPGGIK